MAKYSITYVCGLSSETDSIVRILNDGFSIQSHDGCLILNKVVDTLPTEWKEYPQTTLFVDELRGDSVAYYDGSMMLTPDGWKTLEPFRLIPELFAAQAW